MKFIAEKLSQGETITFNPRGNSMTPRIKSGQEVTVKPVDLSEINVNDVVLAKVKGRYFLHLVKAIDENKGFLIGNMHGRINGWTHTIFGKAFL